MSGIVQAVVFDLDGVLVDCEELWDTAEWSAYLTGMVGVLRSRNDLSTATAVHRLCRSTANHHGPKPAPRRDFRFSVRAYRARARCGPVAASTLDAPLNALGTAGSGYGSFGSRSDRHRRCHRRQERRTGGAGTAGRSRPRAPGGR